MQNDCDSNKENIQAAVTVSSVKLRLVEDAYGKAMESLKPKNTPDEVHHRDLEKTKLTNFLRNFLLDEGRGLNTLIITGKPGAGKSLLVNNLLDNLRAKQYDFFEPKAQEMMDKPVVNKRKKIEVLQFNAMAYSMCFPLLLEIINQIFELSGIEFDSSPIKNGTYLLEFFKNKLDKLLKDHVYIVTIDELDTLAKHDQKNFELINDLLNIQDKGIVKIGISNTLDLFAKYKNTKKYVESRQMAFKPYENDHLWGILKERLNLALKGSAISLDMVVDEGIMLKVCKKIHKNAFGDIRLMLAIVKDIFERKLMKIKKQARQLSESQDVVEGDLDVPVKDVKINILESVSVVDEKYSDVQGNIISTLSLPNQTCLLAMYFCLQDKKNFVIFDTFVSKLNQCYENLGIPRSHMDLEQSLMMLEVYKFIDRPTKLPKGMPQVKSTKIGSKGTGMIESKFNKEELKQYLQEIPAFSLFFESNTKP